MEKNDPIAKKIRVLIGVILVIFLVIYYGSVIMMIINTFSFYDGGCWLRYTKKDGVLTTSVLSSITSVKVNANANYRTINVSSGSNSTLIPDPRNYGRYVGSPPFNLKAGSSTISIGISGTVSLCKSYLPAYDLQSGNPTQQNLSGSAATALANQVGSSQSIQNAINQANANAALNPNGQYRDLANNLTAARSAISTNRGIPIPRVGDPTSLALRFPSNTGNWRNVVELFAGDSIQLVVGDPAISTNTANLSATSAPVDAFNGTSANFDCSATTAPYVIVPAANATSGSDTMVPYGNKTGLNVGLKPDPVCGRFTPYANANYIAECKTTKVTTCGDYRGWQCACGLSCPVVGTLPLNCHTSGPDANGDCNFTHSTDNHGSTIVGCCGGGNDGRSISYPITTVMSATLAPTPFTGGAFAAANEVGGRVFSSNPVGSPNTFPRSNNIRDYLQNYNSHACISDNSPLVGATSGDAVTNNNAFKTQVQNYNFWLTQGNGLMLKLSTSGDTPAPIPSDVTTISFSPDIPGPIALPQLQQNMLAGVSATQSSNISSLGNLLYSNASVQSNSMSGAKGAYLQLGYISDGNPTTHNAGGYTIYVNHTKCQRSNGKTAVDSYYPAEGDTTGASRGQIKYVIAPTACDINNASSECPAGWSVLQRGVLDFQGGQTMDLQITNDANFQLSKVRIWFLIDNKPSDYQDSQGEYELSIGQEELVGKFSGLVLMPLVNKVKNIANNKGMEMFSNLTCYGRADKSRCHDFFLYIKALLTLYIFIFGAMFALGKIQLNQKELLTHVIKVIFIGGLINGDTFNFFNSRVFPLVFGFSNEIISNFGGYSGNSPFTFLDEVMDKLLFSKLALFQMLSLISGGITGIAMFMMAAISIMIFIAGVFQALCIYIFAQLILSFLIGIAPLFLTFALFKETRDLFQKWLNNVIKYMLEPIIVIMGLAIFTKLFAVYMDNVLGYSVCFKCAIPFTIPKIITSFIPAFPSEFQNIQLFCFYWFGPWGVDNSLGLISLPIPYIIGMGLIAFCNYTYIGLVPGVVTALTGVQAQTSAVGMGQQAASDAASAAVSVGKGVAKASKKAGKFIARKMSGNNKTKALHPKYEKLSVPNSKVGGAGEKPGGAGEKPDGVGEKPDGVDEKPDTFESKANKRTAKGGGMDAIMAKRKAEGKMPGGKKP